MKEELEDNEKELKSIAKILGVLFGMVLIFIISVMALVIGAVMLLN